MASKSNQQGATALGNRVGGSVHQGIGLEFIDDVAFDCVLFGAILSVSAKSDTVDESIGETRTLLYSNSWTLMFQ